MGRFEATRDTLRVGDREIDARVVLGVTMVVAAVLDLWLGRGTTFTSDEIDWLSATPGLDVHQALAPYNGHLILGARLVYDLMLHVFGVSYFPFRVLALMCVFATIWLLFRFARPRVGGTVALAPCLILLVFGADALHVLLGNAILDVTPLALGIGAILALERNDRLGDVAACALLIASIGTYSTGLAFVAGAAVLAFFERRHWTRVWVFLLPAMLYVAWFAWASGQPAAGAGQVKLSSLLLAPIWAADSIGNVSAALAGLSYEPFSTSWAPVTGFVAVGLAVLGIRRGTTPRLLAMLAIPLTFWILAAAAQAPPMRSPEASRYLLPGAVMTVLFAAEAGRGVWWRRSWLVGIAAVAALGITTNLGELVQVSNDQRTTATITRFDLAALEAAGGKLGASPPTGALPGVYDPGKLIWAVLQLTGSDGIATGYLDAVNEFGSVGYSEDQLEGLSLGERTLAVGALQHVVGVTLTPTDRAPRSCRELQGGGKGQVTTELPRGGAVIEADLGGAVSLSRFGSLPVPTGTLAARSPAALVVPADAFHAPWSATIAAAAVRVCKLAPSE